MRNPYSCENKMAEQSSLNSSDLREFASSSPSENDDEAEAYETIESVIASKRRGKGRKSRPMSKRVAVEETQGKEPKAIKAAWTPRKLADVVDVVVSDDAFKKRLIFTNTSNATNSRIYESIIKEVQARTSERGEEFIFSVTQVRNKLKKLNSVCKKVALKTSTASGISRFLDKYGKWFQILYPIVKQRESCDPTQSLEPCTGLEDNDETIVQDGTAEGENANDGKKGEKLFVPKRGSNKRSQAMEDLKNVIASAVDKVDKTDNLIKFSKIKMKKLDNMSSSCSNCWLNYRMHPNHLQSCSKIKFKVFHQETFCPIMFKLHLFNLWKCLRRHQQPIKDMEGICQDAIHLNTRNHHMKRAGELN